MDGFLITTTQESRAADDNTTFTSGWPVSSR
jgi:hypothetical protein